MVEVPPNLSRANIRFLCQGSGKPESECRQALINRHGDLMEALRDIKPDALPLKYHEIYYLAGPRFLRVDDPERDLPRRPPLTVDAYYTDVEVSRTVNGERLIAPFNDGNSLSDIKGELYIAESYPNHWEDWARFESPTIQGRLMIIADRIREKLQRNRSIERARLFAAALEHVELAKEAYFDRGFADGCRYLFTAEKLLREGNKRR